MRNFYGLLATALWPALVRAYAPTDSIQDADALQSGYLSNHNMDPNVVGSSSFGILWQQAMTSPLETWYAKALTYTPNGGSEMLITASNMNNVRVHDAKSGTLIASRQLTPPFLQSDIGCADIPNFIGVTGTPIIDAATDTVYMFAKGYQNNAASGGLALGRYWLYAVQLSTLADVPGFPVLIDGHHADNDVTRYFVGGTVLQRPSLTSLNGVVIGAFGAHCDLFNYTGYVVSVSKTAGVGVVSMFAMEASPGAPTPQALDLTNENGGRAGIWQSGMGLATDTTRSSIYFVTGNGQGHANGQVPASGRLPMSTLDECIVHMAVSSTGVFSLVDYFEPYDYINMDAADMDMGSSGLCLLGPSFPGAANTRLAVTVGKASRVYVVNADNLGGFKQGPGGSDNSVQSITTTNSVFGGVGSYPLEGGYFYFTPVGDVTYAFKYSTDSTGAPFFTQAGVTPVKSTGRAGVGQPTVTTNNGLAGTAILWITDVGTGLNAFRAVPDQKGILEELNLPATPGLNKYQRPTFGNGRVFVTAGNQIMAMGSPVNLPLTCSPNTLDFGQQQSGTSSTLNITCQARIAITQIVGCSTGVPYFQCSNSTLPRGAVAAGTNFTVPVTWNLTNPSTPNTVNTSYPTVIPGIEGTSLNLFTTNAVAGYTNAVPVSLRGTVISMSPFLLMSPGQVDFGGVVLGSATAGQALSASMSITNIGNSTMTITGMAWQSGNTNAGQLQNVTFSGTNATFGQGFFAVGLPRAGSTIAAGVSLAVPLYFNTMASGSYSINLYVWSNGGVSNILFSASAGNPPIATIAVSTLEGGWDTSVPVAVAFGNVLAGTTVYRKIRVCNKGGSVLTITKSKPPVSPQLTATNPYGDLVEGQKIDVGACADGNLAVYAGAEQPNQPAQALSLVWVLNNDGQDALNVNQPFGVHDVLVSANIVSRQVGPLLPDGTARYQYVGCFVDNKGRNLANQVNNQAQEQTNSIEQCQTLCYGQGYALAGVEYGEECWCDNNIAIPSSYTNSSIINYCTMPCTGNSTEACGGDGGYQSMYADVTRFNISAFYQSIINGTVMPTTGGGAGGPTPTANPVVVGQWNYSGCYQDNLNGMRSLPNIQYTNNTMTQESCAVVCKGFNFFGTEYGTQCYCGYTLNTTLLRASESDCSVPCAGNSSELCGAGNRLSVYNNTIYQTPPPAASSPSHVARSGNYSWLGCYTEATNTRALGPGIVGNQVTVDVCAAVCNSQANGTALMGVEYGSQCYCGNVLAAGSIQVDPSQCNMLCANNSLQFCGAGNRLDLYVFSPVGLSAVSSTALIASTAVNFANTSTSAGSSSPTSSGTTLTSNALVASSTSSSSVPTPTMNPANIGTQWKYIGCYQDNVNGRSLSDLQYFNNSLTQESCAVVCQGYNFFGSEYGAQCYCGYTLNTTLLANEGDCNVPCGGNPSEFCGAGNRLSVYKNNVYQATPASPSHVPRAGNYAWLGCYTEATNSRALGPGIMSNQLTVEVCAGVCNSQANGTALMGVEYGSQCFCGNALGDGSVQVAASQCNMLCANNSLEFCGAGNRLDLYTFLPVAPSSSGTVTTNIVFATTSSSVLSGSFVTPSSSPSLSATNSTNSGTMSSTVLAVSSTSSPATSAVSSTLSPSFSPVLSSPSSSVVSTTQKSSTVLAVSSSPSSSATTISSSSSVSTAPNSSTILVVSSSPSSSTSTISSSSSSSVVSTAPKSSTILAVASSPSSSATTILSSSSSSAVSTTPKSSTILVVSSSPSSSASTTLSSSSSSVVSTAPKSSTILAVSSSPSSSTATISSSSSSSVVSTAPKSSTILAVASSPSSSATTILSSSSSSAVSTTPKSSTILAVSSSPSSSTATISSSSSPASSATSTTPKSSTVLAVSSSLSSSASTVSKSSSPASSATSSSLSSPVRAVSGSSSSVRSSSAGLTTPSSVSATSTISRPSTVGVATTTGPIATATNGYYYIGCYAEPLWQHALPQVLINSSVTPELCIAYANSVYSAAMTSTTRAPYLYLEYNNQCNMGGDINFFGSAVTSLVGPNACTNVCSGSVRTLTTSGKTIKSTAMGGAFCGGGNQFNLYALSTPAALPTTGGPMQTSTV